MMDCFGIGRDESHWDPLLSSMPFGFYAPSLSFRHTMYLHTPSLPSHTRHSFDLPLGLHRILDLHTYTKMGGDKMGDDVYDCMDGRTFLSFYGGAAGEDK